MRHTPILGLALLVISCSSTLSDGIKDVIDLHLMPNEFGARQTVVRAGGAQGSVWAVGPLIQEPGESVATMTNSGFAAWRGSLADGGAAWQDQHVIDTMAMSSETVYFPRLSIAANPHANAIYLSGGAFVFHADSVYQNPDLGVTSGIQTYNSQTSALARFEIGSAGLSVSSPTSVFLSPGMTLSSDCTGPTCSQTVSDLPYDPAQVGGSTNINNTCNYRKRQIPMAMTVFRDSASSADRLVALLPHGARGDAVPDSSVPSCWQYPPPTVYYHRRALAFFDLDSQGTILDACQGDPEIPRSTAFADGQFTTEPRWLIDLPEEVFAKESVVPPADFVTNNTTSSGGTYMTHDGRLIDAGGMGDPGIGSCTSDEDCAREPALERFDPNFMPDEPKILIDEAHGRGYVFFNRWIGDDPTDDPQRTWNLPIARTGGAAKVIGFSLAPPAWDWSTSCHRVSPRSDSDPFQGLIADAATSGVTHTALEATAGVEPAILAHSFNTSDDSDLSHYWRDDQSAWQCRVFGQNTDSSNMAVPCVTEAVFYRPVALDAERQQLIVTQTSSNAVVILNGQDLTAPGTRIEVGMGPVAVAVDNADRAYVVNRDDNSLSVIDLASRTKIKDVKVGETPVNLYVDQGRSAGVLVYVLDLTGDNIAIYDPSTDKVRFAPTCPRPAELFVDPVERMAVVHCKGAFSYEGDDTHVAIYAHSETFKLLD